MLDAVDDTAGRCDGVAGASEGVWVVTSEGFVAAVPNVNALFALGAPKPAKPENLGAGADT